MSARGKILLLFAVLPALFAVPATAGAEDEVKDILPADELLEMDLEELLDVVYFAAKHKQEIAESPAAVTVISREQIENTACTDIICLLRSVPEVDVVRVVPLWASVGARALTNELGDKALVLIDGREINIEVFGVPFWLSLPVHLQDIERIEVVRGPGSALYGANAHSMVVSITTRKTANDATEAFAAGGEHGLSDLHARVDKVLGDWRLQVTGGHETAGHWRIRDLPEREVSRVRLRLDHETGEALSSLQASFCALDGRISVLRTPGDFNDALTADLQLLYKTDFLKAQLTAMVLDGEVDLDFPLFFGDTRLGREVEPLQVFSSNLDAEVELTWEPFEGNLLIGGGNYRWITFLSDQNDPSTNHQHRVGLFVHDEQRLAERLILTVGFRFDWNNITDGNVSIPPLPSVNISPRLAGVWRMAESQSLRASFGMAFRKPSFLNTSLHMNNYQGTPGFEVVHELLRDSIGNPDLQNESITSFEVGYTGRFLDGSLVVESDVFYNRYRDTITLHVEFVTDMGVPDLQHSIMEFRNSGLEADSLGGSLSLTLRLGDSLVLNGNYTLRHSWYVEDSRYDYQGVKKYKNDRVAWEPAHLVNLSFRYLTRMGLRLGATFHAESSRTQEIFGGGAFEPPVEIDIPTYCFVNAFVSWRVTLGFNWVEAGVRAFNLTNAGFRDRPAIMRLDGVEAGGELIGRRIFLFLRAGI